MKQRHQIHDKTDTQNGYIGNVPQIGNDSIIAIGWQNLEAARHRANINTIQNIMKNLGYILKAIITRDIYKSYGRLYFTCHYSIKY